MDNPVTSVLVVLVFVIFAGAALRGIAAVFPS